MIFQLIRRDAAWKLLPWLTGALILIVAGPGWQNSAPFIPIATVVLAGAVLGTILQDGGARFFAGLPIERRDIYLARVLSALALIWVPACAGAFCVGARFGGGGSSFIAMAGIAMPVALIYQSAAAREIRVPAWSVGLVISGVLAVTMVDLLWIAGKWQIPVVEELILSCAVSAGIFYRDWQAIPHLLPRQTRSAGRIAKPAAIRNPWFPWWLFSWLDALWMVVIPIMAFSGAWANGMIYLWSVPSSAREKTRWLDSLPVSRRTLFAARTLPPVCALALGYLLASWFFPSAGLVQQIVLAPAQQWPIPADAPYCPRASVVPPLTYWQPVDPAAVPLLTAPSGENFRPPAVRVYGKWVYNPFAVGCENSSEFMHWQYLRAKSALRNRRPDLRLRALTLGEMAVLAMLVFLPVFLGDYWRFRRLPKKVRWSIQGTFFAMWLGALFGPLFYTKGTPVLFQLTNLAQGLSWRLPADTRLAAGLLLAASAALYLVAERLFLSSELVPAASAVPPDRNYN